MPICVILFVLPKVVIQMAKYTFENIMYGEKYNIESDVFIAAYELVK